jgi:hypothetical protein
MKSPAFRHWSERRDTSETDNRKIFLGLNNAYKRDRTLNMLAALEVPTVALHSGDGHKRRREFLELMIRVVADPPAERRIQAISDIFCVHMKSDVRKCDARLTARPNVYFHFTATSAN